MEKLDIPLPWKDKLNSLEIGDYLPVDNASSVYSAIRENFTYSVNPEYNTRQFTIRTHPSDKKQYVWRTEDKPNIDC